MPDYNLCAWTGTLQFNNATFLNCTLKQIHIYCVTASLATRTRGGQSTVGWRSSTRLFVVSQASRTFLYFRWEEREGEKNTSGNSGQLPVPRRNVIIAAGHAHGRQIKTLIQLCVAVLRSLCPHWQTVVTGILFRTILLAHVEKRVVSKVDAVCNFTYWKSGHRRGFRRLENSRVSRNDAVLALARSLSSAWGVGSPKQSQYRRIPS